MEERDTTDPLEASSSVVRKKNCEADCCANKTGDVSMPICFLIKEQAKSHVAIQDLQKRVETIENVQNDVIDSLAEIKVFLCCDSRTFSNIKNESSEKASLNITKANKLFFSPIDAKKVDPCSSKECANLSGYSPKQLECKIKEFALESDKQDSGLDSDQLSLNRHSLHSGKPESGDELLQLLDEISVRTEVLQKQLTDVDLKSVIANNNFPSVRKRMQNPVEQDQDCASNNTFIGCSKQADGAGICANANLENICSNSQNCYENKYVANSFHKIQKKAANKIDSAIVSSILKETNVIDLQRQVLIYLVENAVLHTKVMELTQLLSSKCEEGCKIEQSLREESRLLMMENRELRIGLDEQKLETNSLRSKLLMMERVLSSISFENRELTSQLSEFLGIPNLSQKEHKLSSSYTFGDSKISKRSSLPSKALAQSDTNLNCTKSRLMSNASNFLDVTVEEPIGPSKPIFLSPPGGFDKHRGPVYSSTPMAQHTKLKDVKMSLSSALQTNTSFQPIRKHFKPLEKDAKSVTDENRHGEVLGNFSEIKNLRLSGAQLDDVSAKFPFNTILEKLKANSEYRLSRTSHESALYSPENLLKSNIKTNLAEEIGESSEGLLQSNQAVQGRKGKNIHQRIQKILDRITSEDPS